MSLIISGIKLSLEEEEKEAFKKALKIARLKESDIENIGIYKSSIDARKKPDIKKVVSVVVSLRGKTEEEREAREEKVAKGKNPAEVRFLAEEKLIIEKGSKKLTHRPVIVGFGPAGMFAALVLAREGYAPIVIERGEKIENRAKTVSEFWNNQNLNTNSNVQFGEGGAGSFSDGKLTTRINDKRCHLVLEEFVSFGAPKEILTKAKPHIGTDKLRGIVKGIREEIISLGGEVRFNEVLEDIVIKNGKVEAIKTNKDQIPCEAVILAIGHSARDTFEMLFEKGVFLEPKGFSVGFRIEHLQSEINKSLYGENCPSCLPQGEYQLSKREGDKGVYTFCMCPGGTVVGAASEENTVVTNGMSEFARDMVNANSAVLAEVKPADFEDKSPLGGIAFQRKIEHLAYLNGSKSYKAPCQNVGRFLNGEKGFKMGRVTPSIELGVKEGNFEEIFPKETLRMLREGISFFGRKIKGFDSDDAVITAPETRSSSPVRITRGETFEALNLKGLYPSGEGAGYAGGIMSAAVDGIRAAQAIIQKFAPFE